MGVSWGTDSNDFVCRTDIMVFENCITFERFIGNVDILRRDSANLLGGIYKYRDGFGYAPRRRHSPSLFKLRRIFNGCPDDSHGIAAEYQHEEVYSSPIILSKSSPKKLITPSGFKGSGVKDSSGWFTHLNP